jgi:tRNA-Thr(GGU) m(6)t(6)A37 methyltransferase TsaA
MKITPIGQIHAPYRAQSDAPRQGWFRPDVISTIEVFPAYAAGLKDIEGFSHLIILYWLSASHGYTLHITTPWDTDLHGLFTTRSPNRPNPIGFAVVELVERKETLLLVRGLDALNHTPLIDIKPYHPPIDTHNDVRLGWFGTKFRLPPVR